MMHADTPQSQGAVLQTVISIISQLMDIEPSQVSSQSYLIRDLNAQSIDLLELGFEFGRSFQIETDDDQLFLKKLRLHLSKGAEVGKPPVEVILEKYPYLSNARANEMVADIPNGPVLKVEDLVAGLSAALSSSTRKSGV